MVVFIKKNSPDIRKKLEEAGYRVCICASFKDAVWLDYHPNHHIMYKEIHGVGATDEVEGMLDKTPEERIKVWLNMDGWFCKDREFYDTVEDFLAKYPKPELIEKKEE